MISIFLQALYLGRVCYAFACHIGNRFTDRQIKEYEKLCKCIHSVCIKQEKKEKCIYSSICAFRYSFFANLMS